jgi:hypothetical protein
VPWNEPSEVGRTALSRLERRNGAAPHGAANPGSAGFILSRGISRLKMPRLSLRVDVLSLAAGVLLGVFMDSGRTLRDILATSSEDVLDAL